MAQEQLVLRGTKRSHTDCVTTTLAGHSGYVNTAAVSPDGSICVSSGGKDSVILFRELAEGKRLFSLDAGSIIHALCFSPNRYWLCAATETSIKIWDLESKHVILDLKSEVDNANPNKVRYCTCLSWSADGSTLFSCYTDGVVRVWDIIDLLE